MKHSQKQILSVLAAAALTVCSLPQNTPLHLLRPALTASAEDSELTEGDFTYTVNAEQGTATVTKYGGEGGDVVIPDTLGGMPVTEIGSWSFFGCEELTGISIPNTVTVIGSSAFNNCTGLTSVSLPAGLTTISNTAFAGCSALTAVSIPASVRSVGSQAFSGCSSLGQVEIPEGLTEIGGGVFRDTLWMKAQQAENPVVVVNGILIDGTACTGDTVIPDGVTRIGDMAFSGCREMTSVSIPGSVTDIGESAFYSCTALTGITIPDSVTSIGYQAFGNCTALTALAIPDSVTSIGGSLCFGCSALTDVTLSAGLTVIPNSAFLMCGNLTDIEIPAGVTLIDTRAFAACSSLTEIVIPEGTERIGFGAFAACSALSSVTIPDSVTSIEYQVFSGCSNLTIWGSAGSYAETYAQQNGYPFQETGSPTQPVFTVTVPAAAEGSKLTTADGQEWFKVSEFEPGQDYLITVRNSDGTQVMLTLTAGAQSSFAWHFFNRMGKSDGAPYKGLASGDYALVSCDGQLVSDESLKASGSVVWLHQDSRLMNEVNGQQFFLKYDENAEQPFSMTENAGEAAAVDIYTNGKTLARCITAQPFAESYVLENSGYAAPEFRLELAEAVTVDNITWYTDGEAKQSGETVFTAEDLKGQSAGVHRVSCLVEGHDENGICYREESAPVSFVIAKGVLPDSVMTFSDVHEEYTLIGDALARVIETTDGYIPSLILCTGDFCNGSQADYDTMLSRNYPQIKAALGGLDTVFVAGNHDSAAAASELSASAGLGAASDLSANGGMIFRGGSEAVRANGKNSAYADQITVYGLNFDAVLTKTEDGTGYSYENVLADIEQFLQETAENYQGELVIISAHSGLHILGKQPESVNPDDQRLTEWIGENMYNVDCSYELAALLNRYAEDYGMDIMYLFGHDHSRQETELLLKEGDTLLSTRRYADQSFDSQTLHFTYAHAGYLSSQIGSADSKFSLIYRDGSKNVFDLIRTTDSAESRTELPVKEKPDYATAEQFEDMAQRDYRQKTGVKTHAEAVRNADGIVTVTLRDRNGKTVDTYTLDAKTGIGTDAEGGEVNLPQTGVNDPTAGMTVCGAFMLGIFGALLMRRSVRRKKEN